MNEPIKCERWLDALNMSLARMYAMPINFYLGLLEGEACHISGGCINTYLRNSICSTHSLACKTFSHPMAWWIYRQVDLRCLHSQCKCPLFVGDLLWNGGGHQCASLMTMKLVIFPTIDMCPRCSSFQPCISQNPSRSNQLAQTLLLWDTTNQHFVYTSSTSIFSL